MAIRCIIIDDEPLAIQIIASHIQQIQELELLATSNNPLKGFEMLKNTEVDLIFLDIQMPLLTGIDFIKTLQNPPAVIFTTAHRNYAIESYELNAIDYLLKPITFIRFFKAINKFKKIQPVNSEKESSLNQVLVNDHIYVNSNKKFIKIRYDQILYVESIKDYIRIHSSEKNIITKEKISEFETKLPASFLRVHRSFIVNTHKISAFTSQDIEIGTQEIPIGNSYKKEVIQRLKNTGA